MEYILTKTIETANAKVRIFSPVLEDKERSRRMKVIYRAAADILKNTK